jgi:hypothetical protein
VLPYTGPPDDISDLLTTLNVLNPNSDPAQISEPLRFIVLISVPLKFIFLTALKSILCVLIIILLKDN